MKNRSNQILLVSLIFIIPKVFASYPATDTYISNHPNTILKSTTSGCHGSESIWRARTKLVGDTSNPDNAYNSYTECIDTGGHITDSVLAKIGKDNLPGYEEIKAAVKEKDDKESFAGLNWGMGLGMTFLSEPIVEEVSIVNNTISVDQEREKRAMVMLESHWFYNDFYNGNVGIGPFLSIGLVGEEGVDPLSAYGGGLMLGFKVPDSDASWNIGVGWFTDTKAVLLKDGLSNGDSTTETDPSTLTHKRDKAGWMLMFSATW
ncbi:MAG: hypothetical protein HRU40_19810 [Saprospiraceae bacterium]|nr:hypothetical protein [Saprospiraceae bacterium]